MFNLNDNTMKTTTTYRLKNKIGFGVLMAIMITFSHNTIAQKKFDVSNCLDKGLPKDLKLVENTPQTYGITTDYFNWDLYGNFVNKTRVYGEYTRGLGDGQVSWKNVTIANSNSEDGTFPEGEKQTYMEGFQYAPSADMVQASVFKDLINAVIAAALVSLIAAVLFYFLQAPDVAMAEAAIGAALTAAIFIIAIRRTNRYEE